MRIAALAMVLAVPVHAADLQALILTGASNEAAAKPLLERMKKQADATSEFIRFPDGFPKLVQSDTLPGLKPGFFIVIAGLCETTSMVDALKALDAGAYSKPVQGDAAACPSMKDGWVAKTVVAKDAEKRGLRGVIFDRDYNEPQWTLFATLRDKNGVELDARVFKQQESSPCLYGGTNTLRVKDAELRVASVNCIMPRGCPNPGPGSALVTISAPAQTIISTSDVTESPGYRGCRGE